MVRLFVRTLDRCAPPVLLLNQRARPIASGRDMWQSLMLSFDQLVFEPMARGIFLSMRVGVLLTVHINGWEQFSPALLSRRSMSFFGSLVGFYLCMLLYSSEEQSQAPL